VISSQEQNTRKLPDQLRGPKKRKAVVQNVIAQGWSTIRRLKTWQFGNSHGNSHAHRCVDADPQQETKHNLNAFGPKAK